MGTASVHAQSHSSQEQEKQTSGKTPIPQAEPTKQTGKTPNYQKMIKALRTIQRNAFMDMGVAQFLQETLANASKLYDQIGLLAREASSSEMTGNALDGAFHQVVSRIDQLNDDAEYNGYYLFADGGANVDIQTGFQETHRFAVRGFSSQDVGLKGQNLRHPENAKEAHRLARQAKVFVETQLQQTSASAYELERKINSISGQIAQLKEALYESESEQATHTPNSGLQTQHGNLVSQQLLELLSS